jgi:hypothetical protein
VNSKSAGAGTEWDLHFRRGIWIAFTVAMVVAGVVYCGKAADDRSAFVRWRPQILAFWAGKNIWDEEMFPNPPILPLTMLPLVLMPKLAGAMTWFGLKAVMAATSIILCLKMARPEGFRGFPAWAQGLVVLLSFRPILSDLHHGNNNLLILFLVVASLALWRGGRDVASGLVLALGIAFKITPALFLFYFCFKRSWRTVGATLLGLGLFLVVIPSLILGPQFNGECLGMWWHRMLRPYVMSGHTGDMEINQSLIGVMSRLLTESRTGGGRYDNLFDLNLLALDPRIVSWGLKAVSVLIVLSLAWICRTRTARRDDTRLLGEWALVVLTMLFVSERSWKHHYVTLVLPYAYLVYRMGFSTLRKEQRRVLAGALALSALLMASTSSEIGGLFLDGQGHKLAQGYGMFLWAGVVLYVATAWLVLRETRQPAEPAEPAPSLEGRLSAPHFSQTRWA